jgi:hypothetical protein
MDNEFEVNWTKLKQTNYDVLTETEKADLDFECNLYARFDELSSKLDPDNFCGECDCCEYDHCPDEFWGTKCYRTEQICEVGDSSCNREDEYNELLDEYHDIYDELKALYGDEWDEEEKY